jgi:thymidylate synthase (FAD)
MDLSSEQSSSIEQSKQTVQLTKRFVSPNLEAILYDPFPVLDHGFIRVIDYMGGDESVVQAARVSYGTGTRKVSEDRHLIRYLLRNHHTTPFEMCEIKFHIKLPIFIARQWIRHRTANVNEYSARYSILDKEFYLPRAEDLAIQSTMNRQGRGAGLSPESAQKILDILKNDALQCYQHYEFLLNEAQEEDRPALARELARMNLPISWYTQWYWKIDLHNLLHFLNLRADTHAQYEIRVYAQIILDEIIQKWVPETYEAFLDYQKEAYVLSRQAKRVLQKKLQGETVSEESSGLSPREWKELNEIFGPLHNP